MTLTTTICLIICVIIGIFIAYKVKKSYDEYVKQAEEDDYYTYYLEVDNDEDNH